MIETVLEFCADLDEGCQKTPLRALFTTGNNLAHTFRVKLTRRKQPITLTDEKVTGFFIRYRDNATVMIQGSIVEGKASVTLTSACYALRGMFSLAVVVGEGDLANTVFLGEGSISLARTDTLVDEENVIPSLSDLLAQIDRMKAATEAASAATQRADTAAQNANAKAQQAQTAATNAGNAAQRADTSANNANDAATAAMETANAAATAAQNTANAAAATANQAAERAGSAAAYIEGTTVSARKLAPGSTPTAQASTVDGHLHVEYGLVTGDRGEQGPGYTIKGPAYATVEALAAAVTSPAEGDQYNVGIAPPYNIYRWTGSEWEDQGALQGPPGDTGPGVATGGATGQVLTKASNADFDTAWKTLPSVEYVAQTLSEAQKAQARSNIGAGSASDVGTLDGVVSKIGTTTIAVATVAATGGTQNVLELELEPGHTYIVIGYIEESVSDSSAEIINIRSFVNGIERKEAVVRSTMMSGGGSSATVIVESKSAGDKVVIQSYKYSSKDYNFIAKLRAIIIK